MAQFYVDDVCLDGVQEIPIDNFYWMTDDRCKIRLTLHAGRVYVEVGDKSQLCESVSDGLGRMAEAIEAQTPEEEAAGSGLRLARYRRGRIDTPT